MLTIDVRTKAITNAGEHDKVIVKGSAFPNQTPGYIRGWLPPRYPVPVVWDTLPDAEYIVMLYERALLTQRLRDLRGIQVN